MDGNSAGITTLSVRQLARLIGRSEQTVRRWNEQGKLKADDTDDGVGLVFTVDAVREFVRKNPRLLDKAKPELIEMLNGNQAYVRQMPGDAKPGKKTAATAAAVGATLAAAGLVPGVFPVVAGGAALAFAGKILKSKPEEDAAEEDSGYLRQLLMAREAEARKQIEQLEEELTQISREQRRESAHSEYMRQLLAARAAEVERSIGGLRLELEQIWEELTSCGGRERPDGE